MGKKFINSLTGYRAIAAWLIFVYHFFPAQSTAPDIIKNAVHSFHIGVDMFFVLSGFLITYRYFDVQPIDFKKYLVNRFSRIYPMYFLITLGVFVVAYFNNSIWGKEESISAFLSFTMTKALFSKYFDAGIAQGWTLTLEELFYFTAPFYFILIRKKTIWLAVLPVLIFFIFTFCKFSIADLAFNSYGFLQSNISIYIFEFFAGITLALFIKKNQNFKPKINITYTSIGVILLYIFGKSYLAPFINFNLDYVRAIEVCLLCLLGIAPLLWGLIHEKTFVSKILSTSTFVLLGKSSYVFYLIHKGFIPIFIYKYIWDNIIFLFILLNVISILLFRYIEEPLNKLIRDKYTQLDEKNKSTIST